MKKQGQYDADVAAFLKAKGLTNDDLKVKEDARVYTEREMYLLSRGEPLPETDEQQAEHRAERQAEAAMEANYNGRRVIGFDSRGNVETD